MSEVKTNYEKLAAIDLRDKTKKKGKYSYLSWAWAADQLLRLDDKATWTFAEPMTLNDGSMLIFCTVTAFGKSMFCQMPVIDNYNKAIKAPNAMDVNTAMMRGLAKCISLHGLGIYIYAGEDLPHEEGEGEKQNVNKHEKGGKEEKAIYDTVIASLRKADTLAEVRRVATKAEGIWNNWPESWQTDINTFAKECENKINGAVFKP